MSLPPQVLKIKRKRAEEPVDALYLESHDDRLPSKRRVTHHDFVFRRQVVVPFVPREEQPAFPPRGIPTVRPTKPGTETVSDATTAPASAGARSEPLEKDEAARPGSADARFFRLTQPLRSGHRPAGSVHDENLAVFVEDKRPRPEALSKALDGTSDAAAAEAAPRKRPTARVRGPRTRLVKAETPGVDPRILTAMQNMAAEHLNDSRSLADPAAANASSDTAMADATDETEYVYDTYVRHANYDAVIGSTTMDTTANGNGGIGYLVIEEKDQPLWETYADGEDESEQDWDSEQDDENAENYYGADYPEDEVEHDDEYDVHAYQYRTKGASEDEEYGSDDDPWGEEEANRYPWKHAGGRDPLARVASSDEEEEQ